MNCYFEILFLYIINNILEDYLFTIFHLNKHIKFIDINEPKSIYLIIIIIINIPFILLKDFNFSLLKKTIRLGF